MIRRVFYAVVFALILMLNGCSSPQGPGLMWSEGYYNDDIGVTSGYPNGALYRDTRLAVETLDSWHCMFTHITPFDLKFDRQETPRVDGSDTIHVFGRWYRDGAYQLITLYTLNIESSAHEYKPLFRAVFTHEMIHATLGKGHDADPNSLFYAMVGPNGKMTPDLYTDISKILGTGATPTECGVPE